MFEYRLPPHPSLLPWGEGVNICRVIDGLSVVWQEATMTVAWTAARLQMGARDVLNNLLCRTLKENIISEASY